METDFRSGLPDYKGLERSNRKYVRKILGLLLKEGKEFRFSDLQAKLDIPASKKSTLYTNIEALRHLNFITKDERGPIRLKFKTPLCFIADTPKVPYAYLGLLGVREGRRVSETETAVKILENLGFRFDRVIVVTTQEAIGSWSNAIDPKLRVEWHTLSKEELNRIEKVKARVAPKLFELMEKFNVIMDCTSGIRPAGIAYYNLAIQYKVPLTYVYEPEKELIWLISKEDLERELKPLFTS